MNSSQPMQPLLPAELAALLSDAAGGLAKDSKQRAFRIVRRARKGATLRPGADTPFWNALVAEIRPYLKKHGAQAELGRVLGLDRQQVHAYFTAKSRMPDAERTLQLIAWLAAARENQPPA